MTSDTTTRAHRAHLDIIPEKQTDHPAIVLPQPRCVCIDCYEKAAYLDPEGNWWCAAKHTNQALFVAIGYEYHYPHIIFTNTASQTRGGIEGCTQWYAFAYMCRLRPATLESAIFEALVQLKLRTRDEREVRP